MKYTVSEFAQEIRNLYPGDYDELSDIQLVNMWLQKYPNDREKVDLSSRQSYSPIHEHATSRKSSFPIGWVIFIFILGILIYTNPDQDKHIKEATIVIKNAVNKNSSKNLFSKSDNDNALVGGLGLLFGDGLVEGLVPKFVSRKNYLIFSLTNLSYDGKDQIIGIGVLGNVFILGNVQDEIDKLSNKGKEAVSNSEDNLKQDNSLDNITPTTNPNNTEDEKRAVDTTNVTNEQQNNNQTTNNNFEENKSYYVNATPDNPVHFYTTPNYSDMRNARFTSREMVYVQKIENNFGYVEFTNIDNKTSVGWIPLGSLISNN